jgi:FtsH-binding integral membrane protein
MIAGIGLGVKFGGVVERRRAWVGSLFGGALSLFTLQWYLQSDRHGVKAAAIAAFFAMGAFGLSRIAREVQGEYFHVARVRPVVRASLAALRPFLAAAVICCHPIISDWYGAEDVVMAFAIVMVIGGIVGWFAFKTRADSEPPESSRLLENSDHEQKQDSDHI